ncbi:MAG: hypothetical protein HOP15_08650 [Planctomycetes bacterium]|nr:hypothetical protein [Planctomycetota bacterium]
MLAFLGLALGLGALRFASLSSWSLWLDEALTLADVDGRGEVNPVGYRLFGWFYGLADGRPDEAWLRLPAAFFGLVSILATAWAFWPFVGARAAALAAFFVSSSAWHLYWSQNARFYTLAQALALVGGGALLRGLFGGSTWRTALGLLLLALAAATHPSAAFLVGPLLCVPWVARWLDWVPSDAARARAWRIFSLAGLVALVLGSGWALRAWLVWEARQGTGSPLHFAKTAGYLITPTLGLAFLVGALRRWRERESFVALVATVLALAAAALASGFVRVSAQYVFVLLPWIAMVAALGLAVRTGPRETLAARLRLVLLALLVAMPGLVESGLYFLVRHGDRPRWREAYAYVFEHKGARDLVLGMDAPVAEFYLNPSSSRLREWSAVTWLDDWRSRLPMDWARYGRRTWLVINAAQLDDWTLQPTSGERRAEFERLLREECVRVASFEVPLTPRDLDVHVYVTRAPGDPQR